MESAFGSRRDRNATRRRLTWRGWLSVSSSKSVRAGPALDELACARSTGDVVGREGVDQSGVSVVVAGSRTEEEGRRGLRIGGRDDNEKESNSRRGADEVLTIVGRSSSGVGSRSGVSSRAGEAEEEKKEKRMK